MKDMIRLLMILMLSATLAGCRHKDLIDEEVPTGEPEIVFDWSLVPTANPASMSAYLYEHESENPIRFEFAGRNGGKVRIPAGLYSGMAMNSDDTDWAKLRNNTDIDHFEVYTGDAEALISSGISTRSLPRSASAADENIVKSPGLFWAARSNNLWLAVADEDKKFIFYMDEAVSHYTVDVVEVKNMENLEGKSVDGTISGMSAGWLPGKTRASDTHATFPFLLTADKKNNSFHAEFLTFGENPQHEYPHELLIYLILADGSKRYYTFDVADQVHKAPDPRHVHIVVKGLSLPDHVSGGGGFDPDVNDWQEENVDIQM